MKLHLSLLSIAALTSGVNGFAGPNQNSGASPEVSRRESFAKVATMIGGVTAGLATSFPNAAIAYPNDETPRSSSRMGGLLVSEKNICLLTCASSYWKVQHYF
jgi:hypothetical protein